MCTSGGALMTQGDGSKVFYHYTVLKLIKLFFFF